MNVSIVTFNWISFLANKATFNMFVVKKKMWLQLINGIRKTAALQMN